MRLSGTIYQIRRPSHFGQTFFCQAYFYPSSVKDGAERWLVRYKEGNMSSYLLRSSFRYIYSHNAVSGRQDPLDSYNRPSTLLDHVILGLGALCPRCHDWNLPRDVPDRVHSRWSKNKGQSDDRNVRVWHFTEGETSSVSLGRHFDENPTLWQLVEPHL